MKKVSDKELLRIEGGHYHWKCTDGADFTSKVYTSYASAGAGADAHIAKYPSHADSTSVIYCTKRSCK